MKANPGVREYIYVCKPSVFKDGNILDNTFKVVQENVVKEAANLWLNERKVNNELKTQLEKSEKDVTELTNMLQDEINEKKQFENDVKTCNTQLEKSNKEKTNLNKILQEEIVKKVRFENDVQLCNTQLEKLKEKLKEVKEEKYEKPLEEKKVEKPLEEKKVEKISEKKSPPENELEKIYNELKDFDCSLRGGKWNLEELKKLNNKLKDKFDLKTGLKSSDKKQVFCETLKKVLEKKLNKS
jgi:chromosome segregation ATPase